MADMRRILTRSSGYTSSGPTDCGNCSVLLEENSKLKEQLDKSYETAKAKEKEWKNYSQEESRTLKMIIDQLQKGNAHLHMDIKEERHSSAELRREVLEVKKEKQEVLHRQDAMQEQVAKQMQEIDQLAEQIHTLKDKVHRLKRKNEVLHEQCEDTEEQLNRLREAVANAFRKSRLTIGTVQAVMIQDIDEEHVKLWIDFINPLDITFQDLNVIEKEINQRDARWNVQRVITAWLNGSGKYPKSWGTLLDAMYNGSKYLQRLATRTEYKLLEGLACLDFQLCPSCREKFTNKEQEKKASTESLGVPVQAENDQECVPCIASIPSTDV